MFHAQCNPNSKYPSKVLKEKKYIIIYHIIIILYFYGIPLQSSFYYTKQLLHLRVK